MSLAELFIIAIVALVALGPERLARVAYDAGRYWRYGRNVFRQVKAEIRRASNEVEQVNAPLPTEPSAKNDDRQ